MENIPDCVLRGLAVALNHSYIDLCKLFGVSYKLGKGMIRGSGVAKYSRIIEVCSDQGFIGAHDVDDVFRTNPNIRKDNDNRYYDTTDSLINIEDGLSVRDYCSMLPGGRYVLFLRPTTKERLIGRNRWHLTCYDKNEDCLYDTFNCTKGTLVFGFAQIKPEAILPDDDPLSRTVELEKVKRGELWGNVVPPGFKPEDWKQKVRTGTLNPKFLNAIWRWRLKRAGIIS